MEKIPKEKINPKNLSKKQDKKKKKEYNENKTEEKTNQNKSSYSSEIYIPILTIVSVLLYIKSLKGCNGTQSYCLVTLSPSFFYLLGLYLIIFVLIFLYILYRIMFGKNSKYHLIYILPIFIYLLYFFDIGSDLSHHGSYNKMAVYFFVVVFFILYSIYSVIKYLYKNHLLIFISLFFSFLAFIIHIYSKINKECVSWGNGLNNIKIINDKKFDKCYIVHPNKCWINMIDGIFDVSRIIGENCNNFRGGERKELLKYLKPSFNASLNIGYPITTNYSWLNESHFDRFFNYVMNDMIDLDKNKKILNNPDLKPEIILHFDPITKLGKINISINKNEKLINERNGIYDNLKISQKPKYKDFLFLYIDAISRPEFIRSMKQTQKFLNKYYNNNRKSFYQMMKYQSFIFFTQQNTNPMFFGESMFNSNGTSILKPIKKKGYITGHANNICTRALYDIEDNYTENIDFENFDHENIAMMCDPNFYNPENRFTPYMGPYSIRRRCLYGRDTFEYVLEYGKKFWETYINAHKFLRLSFQDAHEGTLEVVKYLDIELAKFLEYFDKKGYLENTAIFIVSDHGNNMIGIYNIFQVEDYVIEKTLASWFMLLPKAEGINEKELIINQQRYVTPYDIHDTLLDIFGYDYKDGYYSRMGQSVFKKINGLERNCKTYSQDMKDIWCRCIDY